MAGVYFAFSGFILRSLDRLEAENALDAMNAINEVILRSWFMPLFFGSSLLYLLLAVQALLDWSDPNAPMLLITCLIYVMGMFLCTALFNVPLKNRLAKAHKGDIDKIQLWFHYYQYWTRWNHLRTASSIVACVLSIYLLTTYPKNNKEVGESTRYRISDLKSLNLRSRDFQHEHVIAQKPEAFNPI